MKNKSNLSKQAKKTARTFVLTGGGTAGHVLPNFIVAEAFESHEFRPVYIGSKGIEKELCSLRKIPFLTIPAGKLRRYFSFQNLMDLFKVAGAIPYAAYLLWKLKPAFVFSKGGYVSLPVCWAAYALRIPVFTHESDLSMGLANRLVAKVAKKVFLTFPTSPGSEGFQQVGPLVALSRARKETGRKKLDIQTEKPVLLIVGGSLGAQKMNEIVYINLKTLCEKFFIIHICGKGKEPQPEVLDGVEDYRFVPFVAEGMKYYYASADMVLSRAGSNAIFEMLRFQLPMLLVPLEAGSRGDQVQNAAFFESQGWALVLREKRLSLLTLEDTLVRLDRSRESLKKKQAAFRFKPSAQEQIVQAILEDLKK